MTTQQDKANTKTGRDNRGRFKKGVSGNPGGRPSFASINNLIKALEKEGHKRGQDFWDMVAKKANNNPQILIAILKKILPDKTKEEGTLPGNYLIVRNTAIVPGQKANTNAPTR